VRPERWQQVREVLDSAIGLSADERGAYLDEVCSGERGASRGGEISPSLHQEAGSVFHCKFLRLT